MMVTDGPVWDALQTRAPDKVEMIKDLAEKASALLTLVPATFPTYTRHDSQHAENVLRLMGELLGPEASKLTGLQAAMLILSAYFHDIGMVYTSEEMDLLRASEQFKKYVESQPEAYLAVQQNNGVAPDDVLLDFCRAHHGEHARVLLNGMSDKLRWGVAPLAPELAAVCASHNRSASHLKEDVFRTDFLTSCDLRLCGILLRLADILDFDASRSPRVVYEHLRLADHTSPSIAMSDAEWRKHLHSEGFSFPSQREHAYLLKIVAAPDEPSVEASMRHFLDVIGRELDACRAILSFCSSTWSGLTLPSGIDRSNIISDGYIYGDFTFRLDRSEILELFMGERLYDNPYAFIRELLQNSIDAVRLRKALHTREEFDDAVEITTWKDAGGFLWVRIDDSGVGMDEEIIHDYFLRVGRSYYRSAEVQADLSRSGAPARGGFAAISRFGVGILSCFTVADTVEVSTRRLYRDGSKAEPLRLSISNAEDFFTLRRDPMITTPMPKLTKSEESYREEPGTSIALRINPARAKITAEALGRQIKRFVMFPPVTVRYNGETTQSMASEVFDRPLIPGPILIELNDGGSGITSVEVGSRDYQEAIPFFASYIGSLRLAVLPIQIDYRSLIGSIRGELLAFVTESASFFSSYQSNLEEFSRDLMRGVPESHKENIPAEAAGILNSIVSSVSGNMRRFEEEEELRFGVRINLANREVHELLSLVKEISINEAKIPGWPVLRDILTSLADGPSSAINVIFGMPYEELFSEFSARGKSGIFWCHNGITLPGLNSRRSMLANAPLGSLDLRVPADIAIAGMLSFSDGLRPDVSVSRDHIVAVPYELHSALQLSIRRAVLAGSDPIFSSYAERLAAISLISDPSSQNYRLSTALADPCTLADDGWLRENVIPAISLDASGQRVEGKSTNHSIINLRQMSAEQPVEVLPDAVLTGMPETRFYAFLMLTLVQIYLDVVIRFFTTTVYDETVQRQQLIIRSSSSPEFSTGLKFFRPLFFVSYDNDSSTLKNPASRSVNASHPLAQWLVEQADLIDREAPVLLTRLADALDEKPDEKGTVEINQLLDDLRMALPNLQPLSEPHVRFEAGQWS